MLNMQEIFPKSIVERDDAISDPSLDNLQIFFRARIREWNQPIYSGECFSVGQFSDFTSKLKPEVAFLLIPSSLSILFDWDGSAVSSSALGLLSDLILGSGTTEIPSAFSDEFDRLVSFVTRNQLDTSVEWKCIQECYHFA